PGNARLVARSRSLPAVSGLHAGAHLTVLFGRQLAPMVSGRVSTPVDARLSFDTAATIRSARTLMFGYAALGIAPQRVLLNIAATWEGIRAARVLEAEGIHCNMTLVFSPIQAQACFDAGVTLVSPCVGRITDWHKRARGIQALAIADDPGVRVGRRIQALARDCHYPTAVMAAGCRDVEQVLALAGIDWLALAPSLLAELAALDAAGVQRRVGD